MQQEQFYFIKLNKTFMKLQEGQPKSSRKKHKLKAIVDNINVLKYDKKDTLIPFKLEQDEKEKIFKQVDSGFIKSVETISKSKKSVLNELMNVRKSNLSTLEIDAIHHKGKLHAQANIINKKSHQGPSNIEYGDDCLLCDCGCERLNGEKYSACSDDIQELDILGSGIILLFFYMKTMILNLFIFLLIFAVFGIATNLIGDHAQVSGVSICESSYCQYRQNVSNRNQYDAATMTRIQLWLGMGGMIIWGLIARFMKHYGRRKTERIDKNLLSSSDFAIKIDNLPKGQYTEDEILEYFQNLWDKFQAKEKLVLGKFIGQGELEETKKQMIRQRNIETEDDNYDEEIKDVLIETFLASKLKNIHEVSSNHFDIKAVQIIYNMEFSRKMMDKIIQQAQKVFGKYQKTEKGDYLITDRASYTKNKQKLIKMYELMQDMRKKFLSDKSFRKTISTSSCLIEFNNERSQQLILKHFGMKKTSLYKKLRQKVYHHFFGEPGTTIFKGSTLSISRAPESSDIIWQNCEKQQSIVKIFIIYLVTFLILSVSFGILAGLSYLQLQFKKESDSDDGNNTIVSILSIAMSVSMQVVNKILWVTLFYLLYLENNHTQTNKIISQMNKTLSLMVVNIILLPVIVNYVLNDDFYGAQGVSGIVFDYHVTSFITILVKALDPLSFLIWLGLQIKCLRTYFIKARYNKSLNSTEVENKALMRKIYELYEGPEFSIAETYVFILSNVMHAAFFCQLQPVIIAFVFLQCLIFYWVCKYRVLKVCKIPSMTQFLIFTYASDFMFLVPIFFGVGSIFVSFVTNRITPHRDFILLPGVIVAGLGLLNWGNPKNIIGFLTQKCINCCKCLTFSRLFGKKQKVDHQQQKKTHAEQENRVRRLQTYYKNSNSLPLIGFEKMLIGETNKLEMEAELKKYCQDHAEVFGGDHKMRIIEDNILKMFERNEEEKLGMKRQEISSDEIQMYYD